jgi:hypothetical protein
LNIIILNSIILNLLNLGEFIPEGIAKIHILRNVLNIFNLPKSIKKTFYTSLDALSKRK